jgi:hypothetical protein
MRQPANYSITSSARASSIGGTSMPSGQTIADYRKRSGQAIWGLTILIDKAAPQQLSLA